MDKLLTIFSQTSLKYCDSRLKYTISATSSVFKENNKNKHQYQHAFDTQVTSYLSVKFDDDDTNCTMKQWTGISYGLRQEMNGRSEAPAGKRNV
jgi:hypothetical protein